MLEELRITGLGVIEDASLPLAEGLTVITGETGAGKTMVVAGLGLLFGGRADAGRVRTDAGRATVEGRLRLDGRDKRTAGLVRQRAGDAGAEVDDDELLLSRTVTAEGRSRAHVAGRSAPIGVLAELGELVLSVHGQSDQMRLLQPAEQRAALDRYAGAEHEKLYSAFRESYAAWRRAADEYDVRRREASERSREAELLKLGLAEIADVAPEPGEDEALAEEAMRLEHAEALRAASVTAHGALAGDTDGLDEAANVSSLLGTAQRALEAQSSVDPVLGEMASRLDEAASIIADVSGDLGSYLADLDADPARLEEIFARRAVLKALTRKYAEDIDGVLAWAEKSAARLAELDTSDEAMAVLAAERDRWAADTAALASRLTASRREAAVRFAEDVSVELTGLAMPYAKVLAEVEPRAAGRGPHVLEIDGKECGIGPDGADEVELRLRANPGAPAAPLQRGASGGELSRVMLAIEVIFAGAGGPPTLVFDEVDAGVGGQAAVEIGRRLARLAHRHQVIVVTHLPQVAAFADRHLVVAKDVSGAVTTSGVHAVMDGERARELARMLAGLPDSDLGVAHAEELLAVAGKEKRAIRTKS